MSTETHKPISLGDYRTPIKNNWCPGCGDFGIVSSIQKALFEMKLAPHDVLLISGVGCSGKTPHYIGTYGIHTVHGRALPVSTGAKIANHDLNVIVVSGDGDGLGIGAGHFVNFGRKNQNTLYMIFDNGIYALTKGQAAPTIGRGEKTKGMTEPSIKEKINPLSLAIECGFTFVARAYSYNIPQMAELIKKGIEHRGAAFIDILQACPTYNNIHTKEYYTPILYDLQKEGYDPKVKDMKNEEEVAKKKLEAISKSWEHGTRMPIGVFYDADYPSYEDHIMDNMEAMKKAPLCKHDISAIDVEPLMEELVI